MISAAENPIVMYFKDKCFIELPKIRVKCRCIENPHSLSNNLDTTRRKYLMKLLFMCSLLVHVQFTLKKNPKLKI
jgi:hypothetical protein